MANPLSRKGITASLADLIALKQAAEAFASRRVKSKHLSEGAYSSLCLGKGMDFSEIRHYQPGDEIRHMEWRVMARTGKPHIKLFQEERERPIFLLLDFNPSLFFGTRFALKSVIAAELAALLSWRALKQGDRISAFLFSEKDSQFFASRGKKSALLPLLKRLSDYTELVFQERQKTLPLSQALSQCQRLVKPGSWVFIISDFYHWDDKSAFYLHQLQEKAKIFAYHLCDPLELATPAAACYPISNGQEEKLWNLDDRQAQQYYSEYCKMRIVNLQTALKRLSIPYFQVVSGSDLVPLVHFSLARKEG